MRIPGVMLRDSVTIEPYAGHTGAGGPSFGAAATVRAHVEPRSARVQGPDGEETVASAVAFVRPDVTTPVGSRVTWDGKLLTVLAEGAMHDTYRELRLGGAGQGGA